MLNLKKKIKKYSTIFVDVDNTLFNYTYAHRIALGRVLEHYRYSEDDYSRARVQIKKRNLKVNHHKKELYFKVMAETKGRPLSEVIFMSECYETEFLRNIKSDKSMLEGLRYAKENGKTVVAITNFYIKDQLLKLEKSGFIDLIDFLVTSEEYEEEKPNLKLFERAHELAGFPDFSDIIMFGDSLVDDFTTFGVDYCPYNCSKLMISITGKSGAGKSSISEHIQELLGAFIIEGDGYHKYERTHEKWNSLTHYNPEANNLIRLGLDIQNIYHDMGGSTIPIYNHHSGTFDSDLQYHSDELDVVIIDGLHSLYPEVTGDYVKIKIYVDNSNADIQKINRDTSVRNKTEDEVLSSIQKREEDYSKYVEIQREFSNFDIIVQGDEFKIVLSDDFNLELLNTKETSFDTGWLDISEMFETIRTIIGTLYRGRYV